MGHALRWGMRLGPRPAPRCSLPTRPPHPDALRPRPGSPARRRVVGRGERGTRADGRRDRRERGRAGGAPGLFRARPRGQRAGVRRRRPPVAGAPEPPGRAAAAARGRPGPAGDGDDAARDGPRLRHPARPEPLGDRHTPPPEPARGGATGPGAHRPLFPHARPRPRRALGRRGPDGDRVGRGARRPGRQGAGWAGRGPGPGRGRARRDAPERDRDGRGRPRPARRRDRPGDPRLRGDPAADARRRRGRAAARPGARPGPHPDRPRLRALQALDDPPPDLAADATRRGRAARGLPRPAPRRPGGGPGPCRRLPHHRHAVFPRPRGLRPAGGPDRPVPL